MFATLSRFRRHVAVLSALALMASVLAAVPIAADEHPEADYEATFDACIGKATEASGFEDVPASHSSAGAIDCIAYYGITQGTSAITYSPVMSVSREHMALFLTRLAGLVGIEMSSDPSGAGFEDIGELSAESQTAINQLADLGITQGTSATTYSPDDAVKRGHMALFISRLMDKMDPFADPNAPDDAAPLAYIPKQVEDTDDKPVSSPFTDLGGATKEAYDAITALWEMGVASGISDTSYAPSADITRAAMADFMVGVLDHSNARPAGVTMQVDETTDFATVTAVRAISVRDDNFAPVADVSVKFFSATESGGIDDDTGKCLGDDDPCDWSDNEEITNDDGNNFDRAETTVDATTDNAEASETWYAWMGSEDNSEFVKGSSGEAMVTLTAKADALGIRVTADINENANDNTINIGKDTTVVLTVQLIDNAGADAAALSNAKAVAKEGVEISITAYSQTPGGTVFPLPTSVKTDENGQAMFTINGPKQDDDDTTTQTRADALTFSGDANGDGTPETRAVTVNWTDVVAAVATHKAEAPSYVIVDDGMVKITVTVSYYDQYGNPAASGDALTITMNNPDVGGADGEASSGTNEARVRSNGTARFTANLEAAAGAEIAVTVSDLESATGNDAEDPAAVLAVRHAHKNDDGKSGDQLETDSQVIVDADNDRFIIDSGDTDSTTARAGVLYSYDSGDTFIVGDATVDMDKFEEAIATNGNTVTVVFYSPDGTSIFSVDAT